MPWFPIVIALLFWGVAQADTQISGSISQNATWQAGDGPYVLSADVLVPSGVTLTIEPGALIYMSPGARIVVDGGSIKALGTQQNPIKVTALASRSGQLPAKGEWGGWIFRNATVLSRLDYVDIEYGKGISVSAASLEVNHVTIKGHQGAAIQIDASSSLFGAGNSALENDLNAILVPAADIKGTVTWGVKGIPFLVQSGVLSVGVSPSIASVTGPVLERGRSAVYEFAGSRLAGLASVRPEASGLTAKITSINGDVGGRFEVSAAMDAPLGPVAITTLSDAGEARLANALTIVPRKGRLTAMSPNRVVVGQGAVSVELGGDTFGPESRALLDDKEIPTQLVDSSRIRVTVPNQTKTGGLALRVRNPDADTSGGYAYTDPLQLAVDAQSLLFQDANVLIANGESKVTQLRLSYPAVEDTVIKLTSSNPAVVSVPATVLFPAGSNEKTVQLTAVGGGTATISANQNGYTTASLSAVVDVPLSASVEPSALVLPIGGADRQFTLSLSHVETAAHTFSFSVANPAIVSLAASSVTIVPGQVSVPVKLKGLAEGYTEITATSPMAGTVSIPVYVSAEYDALSTTHTYPLGIYIPGGEYIGRSDIVNTTASPSLGIFVDAPGAREEDPRYVIVSPSLWIRVGNPDEGASPLGEIVSQPMDVVVGSILSSLGPTSLARGQIAELIVYGANLDGVNQVSVSPAQGIVITGYAPAQDGRSVRISFSVAADATLGGRRFTLATPTGVIPAKNGADRLLIVP